MTLQIIILNTSSQPDGSFSVSGVFWLAAPSNNIIPLPKFQSQVPFIDPNNLLSLQYGNIVEQSFNSGLFASGTILADVQTALQAQYTAAQAVLTATNSPLSGLIGSVYDGASWASSNPFLQVGGVTISSQYTQRVYTWSNWKAAKAIKGGPPQYNENTTEYTIWFYDDKDVHICNIFKGTVPAAIISGGYTQVQNDSDKSDFETNFKSFINKQLTPKSYINLGYTTSSGSTLTVIRATAYTEQTTNAQRSLVSTSASDAGAGIGARTVQLTYFDQTLLGPFYETVTLNGTTPVNTVGTNICFIEKIEVLTVGSQLSNVGTVNLKGTTAGGGVTVGSIPAGDGITNWCHHYVGINKTMTLISVIGSIHGPASGSMEVHRTVPTDATRPELTIAPKIRIDAGDSDKLDFEVPILIAGPALVVVYGRSDSASGTLDWSVGMGYYEA